MEIFKNMFLQDQTALKNFIILVNIGILSFVTTDDPGLPSERCPRENPHPFRNKTFCCSRPVDFQWNKDGYCYGRRQKCSHSEGCGTCESNFLYVFTICVLF